ncbi:MAG: nucleotidyltransferase family protein [Terracidiphilus sp.]
MINAFTFEANKPWQQIPPEFASLLFALQLGNPDTMRLKKLSDNEWTNLLAFCDVAHLTLQIAQLPIEVFPLWVVERLKTNLADNALRFERVKATYREAAKALDSAGVEHVVIKGFTQSPDYVADPRMRSQSDIDIFCPADSINAANRALQAIGYSPFTARVSYDRADHLPTLVRPGDWKWRGNLFDPEMPLSIELHFCLWNDRVSRICLPDAALFWERRTKREVDGLSFPCLSSVDHLAYLTLHILRNLIGADWIVHHVRELAVFLDSHAEDETFWHNWYKAHSPLLRSFQSIAIYYAHAWFDCHLHPVAAAEIDKIPVSWQRWLHSFAGSALESMFHQNKDCLWLHLNFLSSHWDKWRIIRRALIPSSIGSIHSPALLSRNRRLVSADGRPLWMIYMAYLCSRTTTWVRGDLVTLSRGLRWRVLQRL